MKGFLSVAAMLVAIVVCLVVCTPDVSAQQCNVNNSNQVSSAAAIQNQAVIDQLTRLQAQITATPRVSTATASTAAPTGSVAARRALSAPQTQLVAAPVPAVSAVATSSSAQPQRRRFRPVRNFVNDVSADSVAITRRNGRTVAIAR